MQYLGVMRGSGMLACGEEQIGLAATFLTLWDERRGRLVRFRDAIA